MSYNKRPWANGDLITKERMNNIEDGIYDAHDKINAINNKVEENTTDTNTARQDISDIKLQIGTEELTTTSKKIKGAINELGSQIKEKASKNEVFSMANMGQDIKEAMTGGSVAVVGKNAILTENIVDEQVTFNKVDKNLKSLFSKEFSSVALNWNDGSYYDYKTAQVTVGDIGNKYADIINVSRGDFFKISGKCKWNANLYMILDENNTILEVFPNQSMKQEYENIEFIIPNGGTKLLLNQNDGMSTELYKINIMFNCAKIKSDSLTQEMIKNNAINYYKLDSELQENFNPIFENIALNWNVNGYYDKQHATIIADNDTSYAYADVLNVTSDDKFIISGASRWNANLYMILDENNTILEVFPNTSESSTTYNDILCEIPNGGVKLLINKTSNVDTVLKKIVGYKLKNNINKKWVAFGDSLTDVVTLGANPNYTNFIADNLGLQLVNCGKGGTGYINNNGGTQQFYNRTSSIPADTDILTVFGSFNDLYMNDIPVGTITDTGTDTLYGAINTFLKNCWDINPSMMIGIISPTPWHNWWRGHDDIERKTRCVEYVNVLKTVAEYYSLPFLDLFSCSNLRPWEERIRNLYYLNADGVHPNSLGHEKYIVPKIESFIKSIIQ